MINKQLINKYAKALYAVAQKANSVPKTSLAINQLCDCIKDISESSDIDIFWPFFKKTPSLRFPSDLNSSKNLFIYLAELPTESCLVLSLSISSIMYMK